MLNTLLAIFGPLLKMIMEVLSEKLFKIFTAPDVVIEGPKPLLDRIEADPTPADLVSRYGGVHSEQS